MTSDGVGGAVLGDGGPAGGVAWIACYLRSPSSTLLRRRTPGDEAIGGIPKENSAVVMEMRSTEAGEGRECGSSVWRRAAVCTMS